MSGTIRKLPALSRRKVRTRSSHHGPYGLGYTRATMVFTTGSKLVITSGTLKKYLSSDCILRLEYMKEESLVIADQHAAVNTFSGLVHTARHAMGIYFTRNYCANRKGVDSYSKVSDWGEVVTR
jgi:hypothetical protein